MALMNEKTFKSLADAALSTSTAEHTFVSCGDSESTTLRFANNQVVQHVSVRGPSFSVRVAFGKKVGSSSTNRLDRASIMETVRRAEVIAKLAPEDPEYLPPLGPQQYTKVPGFRSSTARATPMQLARRAKPTIDLCEKSELQGAGIFSNTASVSGIAASTGLRAFDESTEAEFSLTASAAEGSGWTFNSHRDIDSLDVEARTRRAVDKAVMSKEPREIPAGHYPVILEPAAVAGVFGAMMWNLGAKSYYKGDSAFVGKLDKQVIDANLSLRTDPAHPDLLGSAFGGDGMANRPQAWIDKGVLKQLYFDRFTAKERGVEPTPWPSAPILEFAGERARSLDDIISKTERAILITNFWYIRSVDPADLTITGMTRDGTFLVENGKIVCGLKQFRFHDSPLRCFAKIDMATTPMEAITLERGKMLLPAVRLPDFHLSSVTKF